MVSIFRCDVSYKFSSFYSSVLSHTLDAHTRCFEILNLSAFVQCNQINLSFCRGVSVCSLVRSLFVAAIEEEEEQHNKQ